MRVRLVNEFDIRDATVGYTAFAVIGIVDLWWLYDTFRIMAPADAWLQAAAWEGQLPQSLDEKLSDPDWWHWFDQGIAESRRRDL